MQKSFSRLAITSVLALTALPAQAEVNLDDNRQKISYSVGILLGGQLANDFEDLDLAAFVEGFNQQFSGEKTLITAQEAIQNLQAYQQTQATKQSSEALADSTAFLSEKKQEKGVIETDSGLMYKVLKEGTGAQPIATDTVTVHYQGTLMNGQEFDSSYSRGEPASFQLSGVIPGWTEGVQLMKEGAKFEFYIHPDLAYGERGAGDAIGPNQALVFIVELIKVGS